MTLDAYRSGSTEPWTVSVLCSLVRVTKPKRLLELGTYKGLTTRELAKAMPPDATLTTVDLKAQHGGFDDPRVTFVEADALAYIGECPVPDFVFVDDDHSYDHVAAEVGLLSYVMDAGLIVLHDVVGPFGLDRIVREHGGFIIEQPLLHVAGGLGVIEL